jgi:hypothetical protein
VDLLGPPPLKTQAHGLIGPGKATYWPDALNAGPSKLRDILHRCDSVIHLNYHYPKSSGFWTRLQEEVSGNLLPTVDLLDSADQAGVNSCVLPARPVSIRGTCAGRTRTVPSIPRARPTPS